MTLIRGYSDRATFQYTRQDIIGWENWTESGYTQLGHLISLFEDGDGVEQLACAGYCHFVAIDRDFYAPGLFAPDREPNRQALCAAVELLGTTHRRWTSINEFGSQKIGFAFQDEEDALKLSLLLPDEAR